MADDDNAVWRMANGSSIEFSGPSEEPKGSGVPSWAYATWNGVNVGVDSRDYETAEWDEFARAVGLPPLDRNASAPSGPPLTVTKVDAESGTITFGSPAPSASPSCAALPSDEL